MPRMQFHSPTPICFKSRVSYAAAIAPPTPAFPNHSSAEGGNVRGRNLSPSSLSLIFWFIQLQLTQQSERLVGWGLTALLAQGCLAYIVPIVVHSFGIWRKIKQISNTKNLNNNNETDNQNIHTHAR